MSSFPVANRRSQSTCPRCALCKVACSMLLPPSFFVSSGAPLLRLRLPPVRRCDGTTVRLRAPLTSSELRRPSGWLFLCTTDSHSPFPLAEIRDRQTDSRTIANCLSPCFHTKNPLSPIRYCNSRRYPRCYSSSCIVKDCDHLLTTLRTNTVGPIDLRSHVRDRS